ncbi:MAG TPA: beta-propeller domain-containing protein [Actinomycetota bacterium]
MKPPARLVRRLAVLVAVGGLAASVAAGSRSPSPFDTDGQAGASIDDPFLGPVTLDAVEPVGSVSLRRFASCEDFLGHVRATAAKRMTPYGLPGDSRGVILVNDVGFAAEATLPGAAPAPLAFDSVAAEGRAVSGTNVQEAGVDEADLLKADETRLFVLESGILRAVDISDPRRPRLAGSLRLRGVTELLLDGDVLVAIGRPGDLPAALRESFDGQAFAVHLIDVSDLDAMTITKTFRFEGSVAGVRFAGGLVRVVARSRPGHIATTRPFRGLSPKEALAQNREAARETVQKDWLPAYAIQDGSGAVQQSGIAPCSRAYRPAVYGGLDTASLYTIDPRAGALLDTASILADAGEVYATGEALYVATSRWVSNARRARFSGGFTTEIHRFDLDGPAAVYAASGRVPGEILSRWALSEHEGILRVATTIDPWGRSHSAVVALRRDGEKLVEAGRVDGLGAGERIFGVRFVGTMGYVVTFRQVDPLYVIDLSDPANPVERGELKIPGYSSYLHPVGEGRVLGIGQDASRGGATRGTQVSLFDVSDPARPRRIDQIRFARASSLAEREPHAFLHWTPDELAVIPLVQRGRSWDSLLFHGAVLIDVERDSLAERARVAHPAYRPRWSWYEAQGVLRSVMASGALLTVSPAGLMSSEPAGGAEHAWRPWPREVSAIRTWVGGSAGFSNGWGGSARFNEPGAVAQMGEHLFVADTGNAAIRRIDPWGGVETVRFRTGTTEDTYVELPEPPVAIVAAGGSLYVASACTVWRLEDPRSNLGRLRFVAGASGSCDATAIGLPGAHEFGTISALAMAGDDLVVADEGAHVLWRIADPSGSPAVSLLAGARGEAGAADGAASAARFRRPSGMLRMPDGRLLISDTGNHTIRVLQDGRVSTFAGVAGGPGESANRLRSPRSIAFDPVRRAFVVVESDEDRNAIRLIEEPGRIVTVAGGPHGVRDGAVAGARLDHPSAVLYRPDGLTLVVDSRNNRIRYLRWSVAKE